MIEDLLRKHLRGFPATKILDVGPGYGSFSRVAAGVTGAKEVWYFDLDDQVLSWQEQQARLAGLRCHGVAAELSPGEIDGLPDGYDVILCQEVLEHLPEPKEILSALVGKLSSNGRMIVTVPTKVSERLIRVVNPDYMKDEPHGHVSEFDEATLKLLFDESGGVVHTLVPTQPHFFLAHLVLFLSRVPFEGSTGRVLIRDTRTKISDLILAWSRKFFMASGPEFWGRVFPRNYFVVASKKY